MLQQRSRLERVINRQRGFESAVEDASVLFEFTEAGEDADSLRELMALGRFGRPDEIAGAVSFLAGPDAAYVTGADLNIDGGFTV